VLNEVVELTGVGSHVRVGHFLTRKLLPKLPALKVSTNVLGLSKGEPIENSSGMTWISNKNHGR
jgi:hypothetical protein